MSYILDALKKSENERQQGQAPGLSTIQPHHSARPRRRGLWPILLGAALVLNAGVVLVALRPWEPKIQPGSAATPEAQPSVIGQGKPLPSASGAGPTPRGEQVAHQAMEAPAPAPPVREAEPPAAVPPSPSGGSMKVAEREPVSPASPPPVLSSAPPTANPGSGEPRFGSSRPGRPGKGSEATGSGSTAPGPGALPQPKPASRPGDVRDKPSTGALAPPSDPVRKPPLPPADPPADGGRRIATAPLATREPTARTEAAPPRERPRQERPAAESAGEKDLRGMPSAVRDEVPKLTFSFLVYSDRPEERMITINGKRMREGEEVSAGLRLEEITREGAILSWKGQRFHKSVF